jgi:hypothetical protein
MALLRIQWMRRPARAIYRATTTEVTMSESKPVIAANLTALKRLLTQALDQVGEAESFIGENNVNAAIGSVSDLDRLLADARSLHGAAMALHRWRS